MEIHPTPFSGQTRSSKSKITRKVTEAPPMNNSKEIPVPKHKRVFGTIKSTNIPVKTQTEKPMIKPSIGFSQKQPKSTQVAANETKKSPSFATKVVAEKKSPVKNMAGLKKKKKSVTFQEKSIEISTNISNEEDTFGPQTPVPTSSSSKTKSKILGTPYRSAEICSKCKFDKLETSSYWLGQIKLAEFVGKHFVAAIFFRTAFECKAEPTRNLRVELKKYLVRHEHLNAQNEWRDVSLSYGLLKEDSSNAGVVDSSIEKAETSKTNGSEFDREQKEVMEPAAGFEVLELEN